MNELSTLYLFLLIFSVLTVFKTVIRIVSSLFDKTPKLIVWSKWELIFFGLTLSYCLTYIIKN